MRRMRPEKIVARLVLLVLLALPVGALGAMGCCRSGSSSTLSSSYAVGDAVDVQWGGKWWKGQILESRGGGQYKIHYVGWASSWDEVVPSSRLRRPTGTAEQRGLSK